MAGRLDENERLDASGLDALFFVGFDPGASRLPSSPHPSESLCFVQPHYDRPPERQSDSGQRIEVLTTTELRPQTHEALSFKSRTRGLRELNSGPSIFSQKIGYQHYHYFKVPVDHRRYKYALSMYRFSDPSIINPSAHVCFQRL